MSVEGAREKGEAAMEDAWGGCPECGRTDGYLNVHKDHWFVCGEHETRWLVGRNLFSSWTYEAEEDREANRAKLAGYREVKPVHTKPPLRLRFRLWRRQLARGRRAAKADALLEGAGRDAS